MKIEKTKILSNWDNCSAWIETEENGGLLIERYDFSGQRGGDESTFWRLTPDAFKELIQEAALDDAQELTNQTADTLIRMIEENDIPHKKWTDSMV